MQHSKQELYAQLEDRHSVMVRRLAKPGRAIVEELNAKQAHLLHMAVGISGEAGELLDAIKKMAIYQKNLDVDNVVEELGDLEFFMEGLRESLQITREQCLEHNYQKLAKRYGEKYSNQSAQERKDKQ